LSLLAGLASLQTQAVSLDVFVFMRQCSDCEIVDDFRSSSRTKVSSRRVFDSSAYSIPNWTAELHSRMLKMFEDASNHQFTPFERLMEDLAHCGRIQHHYTQNIDCRAARLPSLSQKTVWLHGRLDTMMCHRYPQHTVQVTPQSFEQWATAPCPDCQDNDQQRVQMGKRSHGGGFLRPKVLLYEEESPDESEIIGAFKYDLRQPVDAVIIVGTRLLCPSLRKFAEWLCRAAKSKKRESITMWVNKEPPRLGQRFASLIDYQYLGDCDSFALLVSR
jgi:NAD-dependent SIR2 family protein deacetylase